MNSSLEMKESSAEKNPELQNGEKETFPKHIITIQGESLLYKCTICDKTFKTKANCCYHKHCAGDSEKPYTCSTCNRKFASKTHFDYHSLMHTGVNPFKCDQCDKSFKTRNKLLRHKEVHSDERKLYKCDLCDRSFLRKTSIKVHRKTHTGEKPYICPHCSKAFSEKKKLNNHISSHTGIRDWICEVCGKSYSIKWNLELHKRTHSKVRPYYCEKCKQSFSQNRYLKRHMETHKNSVKYVCNICDKEFSRKDNLQRHILNTHLEHANPADVKVEKIDKSYMTKVVTNEDQSPVKAELLPAPPRTLSVIKSLTKTQQIIEFQCQDIQSQSNRISVIKIIGKSSPEENQRAVETHSVEKSPQHQIPEYDQLKNVEPISNDPPSHDVPIKDPLLWDESVIDRDIAQDNFTSYANSREMMKSPRCYIPKKLVTASYKERSTYANQDHFSTTKSVIMSIEKY